MDQSNNQEYWFQQFLPKSDEVVKLGKVDEKSLARKVLEKCRYNREKGTID